MFKQAIYPKIINIKMKVSKAHHMRKVVMEINEKNLKENKLIHSQAFLTNKMRIIEVTIVIKEVLNHKEEINLKFKYHK